MSIGGKSLHKKDWLTLGALAAIPVGGGLMGMGPLGGLLGSSAGAGVADSLGIGLGLAPGEAAGSFVGSATGGLGGLLGGAGKGLDALVRAQSLMRLAAGDQAPMTMAGMDRKKRGNPLAGGMESFQSIYPV